MQWMAVFAILGVFAPESVWADAKNNKDVPPGAKPLLSTCPESITVEEQDLDTEVKGWGYFSDSDAKYKLDSIMIYAKDPKQKKLVKFEPFKGTETFSEWQLNDNGKVKYYLVCSYTHTSVLLKRELDKSYHGCQLSYGDATPTPAMPQAMHNLICK